jgi:hypothetical protein
VLAGGFVPGVSNPHTCFPQHLLSLKLYHAYHLPLHVQLNHLSQLIEITGPKRTNDLLHKLNLIVKAHVVQRQHTSPESTNRHRKSEQ